MFSEQVGNNEDAERRRNRVGVFFQTLVLLNRAVLAQWRDVKYNLARFVMFTLTFIFFGVLFRDLHRGDFAGVQSTLGVIAFMACFPGALLVLTQASVVLAKRAPFYRETGSNTYKSALFPLAQFISEIPWVVALTLAVRACVLGWLLDVMTS